MSIDFINFTPLQSLAGGALIGLAAALLYAFNGRVMGASGIVGGALAALQDTTARQDAPWRLAFLIGVILGPFIYMLVTGSLPVAQFIASDYRLAAAGLIVGVGTGLGSGCTSGHGICGLARFSQRSLIAVLCFMTAGFVTTFIVNHLLGL